MAYKNLLILVALQELVTANEPTCACSKFHYEEQMLEKMVRMEFSVERMKHDMLEAKETVDKTLKEFNTLKADYENIVQDSKKDLQKLKETIFTPTIAFKARKVRNQSPQANEVVLFTDVLFNYGEYYDNITGRFTAPEAGTYLFTLQITVMNQKNVHFGIVVADQFVSKTHFYDYYTYTSHTADAIVVLKSGDRVWIQLLPGSSTGSQLIEGNNDFRWNTFSGTLVHL